MTILFSASQTFLVAFYIVQQICFLCSARLLPASYVTPSFVELPRVLLAAAAAAAAATATSRTEGARIDALEAKLGFYLEKAFGRSFSGEPRPTALSSIEVLGRAKGVNGEGVLLDKGGT